MDELSEVMLCVSGFACSVSEAEEFVASPDVQSSEVAHELIAKRGGVYACLDLAKSIRLRDPFYDQLIQCHHAQGKDEALRPPRPEGLPSHGMRLQLRGRSAQHIPEFGESTRA